MTFPTILLILICYLLDPTLEGMVKRGLLQLACVCIGLMMCRVMSNCFKSKQCILVMS